MFTQISHDITHSKYGSTKRQTQYNIVRLQKCRENTVIQCHYNFKHNKYMLSTHTA